MNGLMSVSVAVLVGALVLLIGRELVCWYWKVNAVLDQGARLEAVLRNIDANLVTLTDLARMRQARPVPNDDPREEA